MIKLMILVKAAPGLTAAAFADYWRDTWLADLIAGGALHKAVHHHVLPSDIRDDEGLSANTWAGVGCYYFTDRADVGAVCAAMPAMLARHSAGMVGTTQLIVDELWMYDRDQSHLPIKMFAFFKRKPHLTRAAAQLYYRTTHAEIGESINRNRTVRYVQNHVAPDYINPDGAHDYDAGPEIWFKSMDIALDLFGDTAAMETLGRDEETFVKRNELLHFLTDEVVVFERATR